MSDTYILYNPYAGGGKCKFDIESLKERKPEAYVISMDSITSYKQFFTGLNPEDLIVICGGDGTLNRFVNDTEGIEIRNKIYYYAVGSGNDFVRDLGREKGNTPDFPINAYLKDLPIVTIDGKKWRFINGVGYGIDGFCCEEGDKLRKKHEEQNVDKPINYVAIAIKGLLYKYKPTNAKITVDGKTYSYKKVWLAPTMNGHYYGGGMMPTPNQERLNPERTVTLMVMHGTGKLRTLILFPSIFQGEHVKKEKAVAVLSGKDITVEFDRPTPLQVDGETVLGVTKYHVTSGV